MKSHSITARKFLLALSVATSTALLVSACGDSDLTCQVFLRATTFELPDHTGFEMKKTYDCLPVDSRDHVTYDLPLPQEFIDSHPDLYHGETYVSIPGGCLSGTTVIYPTNSAITIIHNSQRKLRPPITTGNVTVLVVNAHEIGRAPPLASTEFRRAIFDRASKSLASQMTACSFGKLNIEMAQCRNCVDGVLEVDLGYTVAGRQSRDVEKDLVRRLGAYGGETAFDHVMYCIPTGTLSGKSGFWTAFALGTNIRSVYNGQVCGLLSAHAHEFGHNLGLAHSGEDIRLIGNQYEFRDYADETGYMGYLENVPIADQPKQCFNAHKHWQLGWYEDHAVDLTETILVNHTWVGHLVSFVDYDKAPFGEAVVIRIGDLYVQYNQAKGLNEGTREYRNTAVIIQAPGPGQVSKLLAGVGNGYSFRVPSFQDTGFDIVFMVCYQRYYGPPDSIQLSITLDDGVHGPQCQKRLPALMAISPEPTVAPTISPFSTPTVSLQPTSTPSISPSSSPSATPSMMCEDTLEPILISKRFGNRTCDWIGTQKVWKKLLCQEGFEAYEQCPIMCDSCNVQPAPYPDVCEDSKRMFVMHERLGYETCSWLVANPFWQSRLCIPGQAAYDMCPETCNTCTDTCEDDQSRLFHVNSRRGYQNCEWLATRPKWQALLCRQDHPANSYCSETCNTCLR